MPRIRLLVGVAGDGLVSGDAGQVIDVDAPTARVWADGVRAELVREQRVERAVTEPAEKTGRTRRVGRAAG